METRLSRVCDAIIEAGWLIALIVTPLYFNTNSSRVFEPDKLHLLRSIALLMSVAWIVQVLDVGIRRHNPAAGQGEGESASGLWSRVRGTPLVLPTLVLVGAYVISTIVSLVPSISFFGSYVRLQGTFSFLSYVVIFFIVLTHLRSRAQVLRLEHAIILTSIPISLYGLIQHYGLDPLPWGGPVQDRVAANMGNAIFVAAYLIMAFFLVLERLIDSVAAVLSEDNVADVLRVLAYVFILGIQVIAIIFTQSRGPWLGFAAGLYVFGMLGLRLLGRRAEEPGTRVPLWMRSLVRPAYVAMIGLTVVVLAFLIVLNIPNGPLQGLRKVRYLDRMGTVLSTTEGTNAVRVLIWEGVVDMMFKPHDPLQYPANTPAPWYATSGANGTRIDTLNPVRLLFGYGPESMWVAYNRFYPPDLAHYEARNASPDRSHNETFDAIVRTGVLGWGAQLAIFGSIFYFALRWLGLMRGVGRRNLFLILLAAGAILAVLALWAVDNQSLRLAGIGLPAGLILGLIAYVTLDLLLPEPAGGHVTEGGLPLQVITRRPLLVLALFSAIVAHYAEVHTGIAIASTLTHFWILSATLVVVGMGWLREDAVAVAAVAAAATPEIEKREPVAAAIAMPAPEGAAVVTAPARGNVSPVARPGTATSTTGKSGRGGRAERAAVARSQAQGQKPGPSASPGRPHAPARSSVRVAAARADRPASALATFLPYVLIGTIVTLILVWDYVIDQSQPGSAGGVFWRSFTARFLDMPRHANLVTSPWLLILVMLTWLLGGMLGLAESYRERHWPAGEFRWGANVGIYAAAVIPTFFLFGLFQASRVITSTTSLLEWYNRLSDAVPIFDFILLLFGLGLAWMLLRADRRPRLADWLGRPALSVTAAIVLPVLALIAIFTYNIKIVQADIYYKNGQGMEEVGQWETSVVLYNMAAQMEPKEDYYYLFLGRALLEYASLVETGTATVPLDLSKVPTDQLLQLAQNGLANNNRENVIRSANAVLTAAQRLNPLNTDHTANLARLYRSWAFAKANVDQSSNTAMRQLMIDHPDQVDAGKLDRSLAYYEQSTSLSPNNAQLWNEQAAVRFIKGDSRGAISEVDRSLSLDKQFVNTYLLRGDVLVSQGDAQNGLAAYKQALALRPNDETALVAVGYYSAQLGDTQTAVDAFNKVIELETPALASAQKDLSDFEAQVARAGTKLDANGEARRQALQGNVDARRAQLRVSYVNLALVLRDAGRKPEALAAAQSALGVASPDQQPTIQQLINELKQ